MTHPLQLDRSAVGATPLATWPTSFIASNRPTPYIHIPRSASQRGVHAPELRRTVHTWCGQMFYDPISVDAPGAFDVCGTCDGRYRAVHRDDGTVFDPQMDVRRWGRRKRWCSKLWREISPPGSWPVTAQCVLCGFVGNCRAGGTAFNPSWGIVNHEHNNIGPLVYCPNHGIDHLGWTSEDRTVVTCRAWECRFRQEIQ